MNQAHLDYWFFTLAALMALNTLAFFWVAKRYRYRAHAVHKSIDIEALALAPSGHGVAFSPYFEKAVSRDIHDGMVTLESLRTSNVAILGSSYSQYRSVSKRRSSHVSGTASGDAAVVV